MKVVGIKQLKVRLSEYVRLAKAGETVLVTERDEVVAELATSASGWRMSQRSNRSTCRATKLWGEMNS